MEGTSLSFSSFDGDGKPSDTQVSGRQAIVKVLQDYADWLDWENLPEYGDSPHLWNVKGIGTKTALALISRIWEA